MNRHHLLILMFAVAAGCAAVVVGMHQQSARRAALMAQIERELAGDDEVGPDAPMVASFQRGQGGDASPTADVDRAMDALPISAEADAMFAAATEPPRKAFKHKKRSKPRFDRDARRMSDSFRGGNAIIPPAAAADEKATAARRALSFVGIDPDAEAVWASAINDPARAAHERQNLIEDLNEEGFPDPRHVTADDLPLIERRLALIEQFAAEAMDDVNAAAFAEAYKDLQDMYGRAVAESGEE